MGDKARSDKKNLSQFQETIPSRGPHLLATWKLALAFTCPSPTAEVISNWTLAESLNSPDLSRGSPEDSTSCEAALKWQGNGFTFSSLRLSSIQKMHLVTAYLGSMLMKFISKSNARETEDGWVSVVVTLGKVKFVIFSILVLLPISWVFDINQIQNYPLT